MLSTNIHIHLFSADHTPSVQLYYLIRGALHGAARGLLPAVLGRELTADDYKRLDRSMDRFEWPWPVLFNMVLAFSGQMSLIDVGPFIEMLTTISRVSRDEARNILGVTASERQVDFLKGLIRRTEKQKQMNAPWPFRNAICELVQELFAVHQAHVANKGPLTHADLWQRFIATPGASKYQYVIALSVNFDEAFLDDNLPGLDTSPLIDFYGQKDELSQLASQVNADGGMQIIPFLGLDYRGHDASTLKDFITSNVGKNRSFKGLKFYPPMGLLPTDDRLRGVFDYCQDNGIPVLSHCSSGGAGVRGRDRNFADLAHPYKWEDVLERLTRRAASGKTSGTFRLCLAHFDRLEDLATASWYDELIDVMNRYDGAGGVEVYSDIAFDVIPKAARKVYGENVQRVQQAGLGDRVLFGSDWWMYIYECADEKAFQEQLRIGQGWWKEEDFEAAAQRYLQDVL